MRRSGEPLGAYEGTLPGTTATLYCNLWRRGGQPSSGAAERDWAEEN